MFKTYSPYIMFSIGTVFMGVLIWLRRKKYRLKAWQVVLFTIFLAAVGMTGVRLLAILEQYKALIQGDIAGGMSFYGCVFLIPILMPLFGKMFKLRASETLDLCAPCVLAMLACMRINCYISGCCGGIVIYLPNRELYPHPQVIECAADLVILWIILLKEKQDREPGKGYPRFLLYYGIVRFFLEFIRDTPKDILFLSRGQIYSLIGILVGACYLIFRRRKSNNNDGCSRKKYRNSKKRHGRTNNKHNGGKSR